MFLPLRPMGLLLGPLGSPFLPHLPNIDGVDTQRPIPLRATPISGEELAAFTPFTQFARAAYCPSEYIKDWSCGGNHTEACDAITDFEPVWTSGDGDEVQLQFVGYWPPENSIVVAYEGTDPTKIYSMLTDLDFVRRPLNRTLFPGIPANVLVHRGFADQHEMTATIVLSEVKKLLSSKNAQKVILVGHSLGGALSELAALYMTLNLPSNVHVKGVTYGTPRVGNSEFAKFFNSKVHDFYRINNERDLIPLVPFIEMGYRHPHGEIHIISPNNAVACPWNWNDAFSPLCTSGAVPDIFEGDILDHLGPYQGIEIGTIFCD
ncbi:hypothetical protein NLI96_g520 [Meripilus lineatus]|uniref:Fungal lipase-type domain-containing protein n=1 Tax=Meripilus lineatus TaxID=2056292 RepID=A0AAD5YIF4_9APHY|nr:hypothetical protein NLI96_g520 [Physisporinus lineatus]